MSYVVGELIRTGEDSADLVYLVDSPDYFRAKELGFDSYCGFPLEKGVRHKDALPLFVCRLPPRTRTDFPEFLAGLHLPRDAKISDFALLGYSGGRLPGDCFSFALMRSSDFFNTLFKQ
jgi:hypothetical protein